MKFTTEIKAIDPADGELKAWCGPSIDAISPGMAKLYCQQNGLGYCKITGQLISEIPCKEGTLDPDWNKQTDYDESNN